MKSRKLSGWLGLLWCAALLLAMCPLDGASGSVALGQRRGGAGRQQEILGTVVGVGGRFGGRTAPFRLIVNRYTTADEVQQLNAALQSGGQNELLRVLSRMEAGRIMVGNNVGVDANVIISVPQETGTKLIVLYERNINFYELRYGTRSEDYRFGYAEMFLRRGRGTSEGTFIPAAKVRLRDGNTWEVEDFGVFPARLMGLQARGGAGLAR
ncbi:MAG TPA: hypothetical protein VGW12_09945 [Pyrinomonadaceae bacterium]|nr:hypothetical protein [Pyrinomonadaceae bacterium]